MQELNFKQILTVSGATCGAADIAEYTVVGSFSLAGGLIGGATTFGAGAPVGGFVG